MTALDAVLKVGGSLSQGVELARLCQEIGRLGTQHRLLVVPGGAAFADLVREHYRRYSLGETTAHRMAILAMDQYGYLLGDLISGSCPLRDRGLLKQILEDGRVPVLLPSLLLSEVDPLPHSWQVTSDSIAAWVAGWLGVKKLILLKDVDGLFFSNPSHQGADLRLRMSLEELSHHRGGVDEHLYTVLCAQELETWVINGRRPGRLVELLEYGYTLGTRITRRA